MDQAATLPTVRTSPQAAPRVKQPRLWNVVLLNDDDHSYEYVIEMMMKVFAHPIERSFLIAKKVDSDGRAIVATHHRELAELKQEQVKGYGKDRAIATCAGSMSCIIEPAEQGEDDDDR